MYNNVIHNRISMISIKKNIDKRTFNFIGNNFENNKFINENYGGKRDSSKATELNQKLKRQLNFHGKNDFDRSNVYNNNYGRKRQLIFHQGSSVSNLNIITAQINNTDSSNKGSPNQLQMANGPNNQTQAANGSLKQSQMTNVASNPSSN